MPERIAQSLSYYHSRIEGRGMWLAGFFEVAGSVGVGVNNRKRPTQAIPFVKFKDRNPAKIDSFRKNFGGYRYHDGHGWRMTVVGGQAIALTLMLAPYSPSRIALTEIYLEWGELSTQEKITAAQRLKNYRHGAVSMLNEFDYEDLVQKGSFLAGVLDNRGILCRDFTRKRSSYPIIRVPSQNKPLLEAIKKVHGGRVAKDERVNEAGRTFLGRKVEGSTFWEVGERDGLAILNITEGHHILARSSADTALDYLRSKSG